LPWYYRVRDAINAAAPFLAPTQKTNLSLLVSAILKKRTLCLSELARAYPTPSQRRVAAPKHDLLHRLKRLWRFTANERVDALLAALEPQQGWPPLLQLVLAPLDRETVAVVGQLQKRQSPPSPGHGYAQDR
jgi:hypothetical protein